MRIRHALLASAGTFAVVLLQAGLHPALAQNAVGLTGKVTSAASR